MSDLVEIHSNWVSRELTPLEENCLSSFVVAGHRVYLHCYHDVKVPDGVTVLDANRILPETQVFRHRKSGSFSMFADLFRYKMLQAYDGVCWVDADIFCLKPFVFDSDFILGEEKVRRRPYSISNAVMKLPACSPILTELIALFEHPTKAAKFSTLRQKRIKYWIKGMFGALEIQDMDRIVAGPPALTFFAQKYRASKNVKPVSAFFQSQGQQLFDPGYDFGPMLGDDVYAAHFLGSNLPDLDFANPPIGSFYAHCVAMLQSRKAQS